MPSARKTTTNSHNTGSNNVQGNSNTVGSHNSYIHVGTQVDDDKVDLPCLPEAHSWDRRLICRRRTREAVIQDICGWISSKDTPYRVYFLIGGIHSGKTTISHTIAKFSNASQQPTLASAIFLPLSVSLVNKWKHNPVTAQMVVNTIAVDLASYDTSIRRYMSMRLQKSPRSQDASATHLFGELIVSSTANTASDIPIVIVLDVLDHVNWRDRAELLQILTQDSIDLPSNVRILVTSRPRVDVLEALHNDHCVHQLISLYDEPGVDLAAVTSSAASQLLMLRNYYSTYGPTGFLESAFQSSVSSLAATSIVSTFLSDCSNEELECLLDTGRSISEEIPSFEQPGHFYFLILWAIANYGMKDHMTGELSLLAFLMEPRSANDQAYFSLGDVKFDDLCSGSIYSIIAPVPIGRNNTKPNPAFTLHPNIIESILVPPPQALVSPPGGYPARDRIAELCLQILCDGLHPNPLSIDATISSRPKPQDLKDRVQEYIPKPIDYASRHVIGHITIAVGQSGLPRILELFQFFLRTHVLHWLELLSYLGAFRRSTVLDLEELLQCLKGQPDSVQSRDELCKSVSDVIEFARRFSPLIMMDPLHLSLAAAYSPRTSSIYQTLQAGSPVRVISGIPENWGPCLGVIESTNHSITLSPDGRRLAVNNGRVSIWDAFTRCHSRDLSSESTRQHALALSSDGAMVSSASEAGTLYLWDVPEKGQLARELKGHTGSVVSVAYSPDGKSLASASLDHTVRIWNLDSGEAIGEPLSEHTDSVTSVTYSPDGCFLASASNDKTVYIWVSSERYKLAQLDHPGQVHGLAWSLDGALIGTGCDDGIVRLWDADICVMTFQLAGHGNPIRSVAFTPDSSKLASGSDDMSIRIWDVATGTQFGNVLRGHTDCIHSIVVCPDGRTIISGSQDHTIRFWDIHQPRSDVIAPAPVAATRVAEASSEKISQFANDTGFPLADGWIRSRSLQKLLWVPHPYRGRIIARQDGRLVIKGRDQTGDTVEELVLELL